MGYEAVFVEINGPGHEGTRHPLREGITSFGRLPSNDVILLGDLVSRHHARILFFDGKASLQDLGSHNGCWVNESKASTHPLNDGDVIRIGNFKIVFRAGLPMAAEASFIDEATADQSRGEVNFQGRGRPDSKVTLPPADRKVPTLPLPENMSVRDPGSSPIVQEISEAALDASQGTLHLIYRITDVITRSDSVRECVSQILEFTLDRFAAEYAIYFQVDPGDPEPVRAAFIHVEGYTEPPFASMSVVRWAVAKNFTVFSHDIAADLRFRDGHSVSMLSENARSLVCAPIASGDRTLGALYIARSLEQPFGESEVDAIEAICHLVATGIERIDYRERALEDGLARDTLARFHSPDVVERIVEEAGTSNPTLERKTATVCFCDIRGFTKFAESGSVESISEFLNTYVEDLSSVVFKHRGTINKLLGDGIVAVFGAPFSYGNDAARAVASALEMRFAFEELVLDRPNLAKLRLRVGISTGSVLTGTIGSSRRMDYTVLGETVNEAARIQAAAPPGTILIGQSTLAEVSGVFATRRAGARQIRGKANPLELHEVLGRRDDKGPS